VQQVLAGVQQVMMTQQALSAGAAQHSFCWLPVQQFGGQMFVVSMIGVCCFEVLTTSHPKRRKPRNLASALPPMEPLTPLHQGARHTFCG
jgi:hypothetical protein